MGEEDPLIGTYVVHYADGSTREHPPGLRPRHLINWWQFPRGRKSRPGPRSPGPARTNGRDESKPGLKIRLFDLTWTNPHPDKEIASLDVLSADKECDPFLVAVTVQRDR